MTCIAGIDLSIQAKECGLQLVTPDRRSFLGGDFFYSDERIKALARILDAQLPNVDCAYFVLPAAALSTNQKTPPELEMGRGGVETARFE
jgi:hypothetical protein